MDDIAARLLLLALQALFELLVPHSLSLASREILIALEGMGAVPDREKAHPGSGLAEVEPGHPLGDVHPGRASAGSAESIADEQALETGMQEHR
jgi:hypothetical protein